MQTYTLHESDHQAWRDTGALCLRSVLSADWLAEIESGFEQSLANPGPLSKDYGEGSGRFFTDHAMYKRIEPLRRFVYESPLPAIAAELMGAQQLRLVDDHLLVKEPGTDKPTYWHHDYPYFQFDGEDFISFWTPLDPVTQANGAMRFAAGSHRWGKLYHPVRIGKGDLIAEAEDLDGPVPDIDADPGAYPIVTWDMQPGDCLVFHGKTLHAASPNLTQDKRRRALAIRFTGDDIRWRPRPYAPADDSFRGLSAGDPIACDAYPLVWDRDKNLEPAQ
jgi:ectoine hydroxylase-related dioxygenase (phytanoyl-CoA dioxygenase family)